MSSNSKLTKSQKFERALLIGSLPAGSEMALTNDGVTLLLVPQGAVNILSTAVASPDEVKIRRKVGEFNALVRWDIGACVPLPASMSLDEIAEPFGGLVWDSETGDYKVFVKE